jgi:hypothetical protein
MELAIALFAGDVVEPFWVRESKKDLASCLKNAAKNVKDAVDASTHKGRELALQISIETKE